MIVKRYYARDMQEAMATIRAELGPDAVILSSKPVRKKGLTGFFQKKDLEVIAAYEPKLESAKAREERENAAYQAALQAVQEAQSRVLPQEPPPSPGQPFGPMDGQLGAQVRSPVQRNRPAQGLPAYGQAPAPPHIRPATFPQEQTRQAPLEGREAARPANPASSTAAYAAARYNQTAQLSHEAQAFPLQEDERPVFTRNTDASQGFQPYTPPEMVIHPPGEVRIGDDLPLATEIYQEQPEQEVFQVEEETADNAQAVETDTQAVETGAKAENNSPPETQYTADIQRLDKKLSELGSIIESFAKKYEYIRHDSDYRYDPQIEPYLQKLLENDVEQELAHALTRDTQEAFRAGTEPKQALEDLLRTVIGPAAPLTLTEGKPIVLFMGPTGVGKTTTLVKLATMCSVRDKRRVGLINTDTYRIAAQEQLRTYADILGVPLKVVYTPDDLPTAISELYDRDVIFVDTAGKRPGDPQHRADMLKLLEEAGSEALPLLAVSAPTGHRAMRELFAHYDFLGQYRLLLTKTDETRRWGAVINACHLSGMPIAYLTGGQSVPDDIEQADPEELIRRLMG